MNPTTQPSHRCQSGRSSAVISCSASCKFSVLPARGAEGLTTPMMSVEVLDGGTIRSFVEDDRSFDTFVEERFNSLDTDHDGLLSFEDMLEELRGLRAIDDHIDSGVDEVKPTDPDELVRVYRSLFQQFDHNGSGYVDLQEFREETRKIMLAVSDGLGFLPVQMLVVDGSFVKVAVERESTKTVPQF